MSSWAMYSNRGTFADAPVSKWEGIAAQRRAGRLADPEPVASIFSWPPPKGKMYSELSPRVREIVDHLTRGSKLVEAGGRLHLQSPTGKHNVMQVAGREVQTMQASPAAFSAVLRIAAITIEAQQRRQGNRPVAALAERR